MCDVGCVGSSIKLNGGGYIDLLDPNPHDIHIEDIAASLSKMCRFNGHCDRFYSVAEHCILATKQAVLQGDRDIALEVLLHDATEAYLGDVVKPLKNAMDIYQEIEANMEQAIQLKFSLRSTPKIKDRIKAIDFAMLFAEKQELFLAPEKWAGEDEYDPAVVQIIGMHCSLAESTFLNVFEQVRRLPRRRSKPMNLLDRVGDEY